ncbi:MAG: flavin reductase family protein [Acidimicrobiales bacterium]
MTPPSISDFKDAVSRFATGVVVVTAQTPEGPAGFTCQTFGSLSLEPQLVTFAAAVGGRSWAQVRATGVVGINILGVDQVNEARRFATTGADRFAAGEWATGPAGSPLLAGAIAHVEGHIVSVRTHGDHDVAIVQADFVAAYDGQPLVFFRAGFTALG